MNIRVAQIGARKSYSLVNALARKRWLHSFCTDFYYRGAPMALAARLCDLMGQSSFASKLRSRRCADLDDNLVSTFPSYGITNRLKVRAALQKGRPHHAYLSGGQAFARKVASLSWDGVDAFYGFSSASLEAFQAAKSYGVTCILDHETAPASLESELVRQSERCFPRWLKHDTLGQMPEELAYAERQQAEANLADIVISPSSFCSGLLRQSGVQDDKIQDIPFAMSDSFERKPKKEPGQSLRVLFAGNCAIRKGLPVLVEALNLLPRDHIDARGAGDWALSQFGWNQCKQALMPLGAVPRSEMGRHYQWADVFVLPTFCDTMGVVILEAMASGVPVIATTNSGGPDLIREGLDGYIIPVNSPEAIVERLTELHGDRDKLANMSGSAFERSRQFTLTKYGEHVIRAIEHACHLPRSSCVC